MSKKTEKKGKSWFRPRRKRETVPACPTKKKKIAPKGHKREKEKRNEGTPLPLAAHSRREGGISAAKGKRRTTGGKTTKDLLPREEGKAASRGKNSKKTNVQKKSRFSVLPERGAALFSSPKETQGPKERPKEKSNKGTF